MPSMSYRQTRVHLMGYYLGIVWQKMRCVVRILLVAGALCFAFCLIVLVLARLAGNLQAGLLDVLDWLFRYRSDAEAAAIYSGMSSAEQLIWRMIGGVYVAVVTGFVLEAILQPADMVKFARYAVIDTAERCLKVRYWVKLPESQYLADASVDVLFELGGSRHVGSSSKTVDFRFLDPADTESDLGKYFAIRGVHTTDVPLRAGGKHNSRCELWEALCELHDNPIENGNESVIRVRIKGQAPSGRSVFYEHCYRGQDVLFGYKCLSIRRDNIEDFYRENHVKRALPIPRQDTMPRAKLFMEHLDVVVRIRDAGQESYVGHLGELEKRYADNTPRPEFCLDPGEHVD